MDSRVNFFRFAFFVILLTAVSSIAAQSALGQAQAKPELIVTWKANTLSPSDYPGKGFPGPRSSVTASVEGYQSGKWLNLSRISFTWVLDGKVIGRGEGLQELSFSVPTRSEPTLTLKVVATFPETGLTVDSFSTIPVLGPQVVVNTPFPEGTVAPQSRFTLEAIPYFWNASSLNDILFTWTANNTTQSSNGQHSITLTVGTPSNDYERELRVNALLQNPAEATEFARGYAQIKIQ